MHLEDVLLALRARLVDTLAVLTEVVALRAQYRQVELRYRVGFDRWVALRQMVHQHAATLETDQALIALVNEAMKLSWRHFGYELDGGPLLLLCVTRRVRTAAAKDRRQVRT